MFNPDFCGGLGSRSSFLHRGQIKRRVLSRLRYLKGTAVLINEIINMNDCRKRIRGVAPFSFTNVGVFWYTLSGGRCFDISEQLDLWHDIISFQQYLAWCLKYRPRLRQGHHLVSKFVISSGLYLWRWGKPYNGTGRIVMTYSSYYLCSVSMPHRLDLTIHFGLDPCACNVTTASQLFCCPGVTLPFSITPFLRFDFKGLVQATIHRLVRNNI